MNKRVTAAVSAVCLVATMTIATAPVASAAPAPQRHEVAFGSSEPWCPEYGRVRIVLFGIYLGTVCLA